MTTMAQHNSSPKEYPVLSATAAMKTGLFQPIPCSDPDISNHVRIDPAAPTVWNRLFTKKR